MPYSPERQPPAYRGRRRFPVRDPEPSPLSLISMVDVRKRSVLRGSLLVLVSSIAAFRMSHFPLNFANPWLAAPLIVAVAGTADTTRCMQKRWNWFHGGVVLLLYTDLMAICMIAFFLLYPLWL